ncbi:hypothetical protein PTQ19_10335 [Microbacterium esteraromaticum]|uniref:Acb2/Tad1 domain-containing protein n=1 Tax=Microbacterium esteraromaticum TaxID=57043 RepID=UPI002368B973|nr:hypothetical protein [Microbacterium esteraromaticum]WDH77919.1 hypothetical protein PTQ19_10335 [Microbacterium esteraromaticum]
MAESKRPEPTAEDRARARFITASTGQPPTDEQRDAVRQLSNLVVELAVAIEELTPRSRNQSLALTALEDVQMRANRAIFATGPSA